VGAVVRPPRGKPGPATRVPRARRQPTRRPRRWGRPLAAGLTLALVAALMPGAHAEGEGDGMPVASETLGDETVAQTAFQTSEAETMAETMAETLEGHTPAPSPEGADGSGDEVGADRVVLADAGEATGGGGLPPERPQPDPAPLADAQQPPEDQPSGVQQPEAEAATGQPLDQAEQEQLARLDAGQEEPGTPRIPPIMGDARGGTGSTGPGGGQSAGGPPGQPPDQPGLTLERLQQLQREKDNLDQRLEDERRQAMAALAARHRVERTGLEAEWDQRIVSATEDLQPAKEQALAELRENQLRERAQLDEIMATQSQTARDAWWAAWLPPAEEPVLVEQDPSAAAAFQRRLAAFRPDWLRAQAEGTPMSPAQVAQQLGVRVVTARDYLRRLEFEQRLAPIVAERTVTRGELHRSQELRQEVGIEHTLDERVAGKVLDELNHQKAMAAARVQPSDRSALSNALGIIQPIYHRVERQHGQRLPGPLVARLTGYDLKIAGVALDLLRLRDSRIEGTRAEETELSRTVQAVEPRFRQQEAPGGPELDPYALAKDLQLPPRMVRAALGLLRSERQPGPQQGQSQMRAVDPGDVAGTPGYQAGRPPADTPGFAGTQANVADTPGLTATDLDTANPGLVPPAVDNKTNPPYTTTPEQAVSTGWLATAKTQWVPAGLATILAAMLAVGCKGAPCSSMLRPALRGFQGVPGQVVPGHLQG
jgi:hypothetical protein